MIDAYIKTLREVAVLRRQVADLEAEVERYRAHQAQAQIRTLEQSRGAYPRFTYHRSGW